MITGTIRSAVQLQVLENKYHLENVMESLM